MQRVRVWLGIVAWRAGSVWPAILCHLFNNLFGLINAVLGGEEPETTVQLDAATLAWLAGPSLAFVLSIWILAHRARPGSG